MFERWFQYYAAISVSWVILSSSMHLAWPSAAIPQLLSGTDTLKINSLEASWLVIMKTVGAIFGAILGFFVFDKLGRIKAIYLCTIPHIIAWLAIAFGTHVAILLGARLLLGVMDSLAFCAVPMYIGETADPDIRGLLAVVIAVCIVFGLLLSNAIGEYMTVQTAALTSLLFPIMALVICLRLPESPYVLIMKGNKQMALKSLKAFKQEDMVQVEYDRLQKIIEEDVKQRGEFMDLFRVPYIRHSLVILIILRCFIPLIGFVVMIFYISTIFEEMGSTGPISAKVWVIIYYVVKLVATLISGAVVDKTGRRLLLICSTVGLAISLLAIGIFSFLEQEGLATHQVSNYISISAMFVYIIAYSIGLGPISILMMGELMPTGVKSYALCVISICFDFSEIVTSQFFHVTNENFGLGVPFVTFGIFAVLSIIFVVLYVPETKGKSLEYIQEEFKAKSISNM